MSRNVKYSTKFSKICWIISAKHIGGISYTNNHGIPRNSAEIGPLNFRGISRNSAELKSLPHKIPYSAEFQKGTSVDTLTTSILYSIWYYVPV
jgi:hypothetical protein